MKIKGRLIKNAVSKILEKTLRKKVGHNVSVWINDAEATIKGRRARVHLNIDLEMSAEELKEMLRI